MMNNKGQTLVIFIIFLPLLIIIMATVIDIGLMYYEKNKLDSINMITIEYGINNLEKENIKTELTELIKKNDDKVEIKKIDIENSVIKINLTKKINSTFGKIIGIKEYKINSLYIGKNIGNKKEIKKG